MHKEVAAPDSTSEMVSEVIYDFFFLNAPTCCSLLEALKFMGSWYNFRNYQGNRFAGKEEVIN